ncbi:MAG: hypothetical protein Q8O60_05945, partial [Deltaproteobacteria bacterium]|nr:hypothetical protein [Deltaproteobacteria bacterium]
ARPIFSARSMAFSRALLISAILISPQFEIFTKNARMPRLVGGDEWYPCLVAAPFRVRCLMQDAG